MGGRGRRHSLLALHIRMMKDEELRTLDTGWALPLAPIHYYRRVELAQAIELEQQREGEEGGHGAVE